MNLGDSIRTMRLYRGLTQAQLGEKINSTQSYVNYMEQKGVSINKLEEVAEILGLKIEVKIEISEKTGS